MTTESTVATVKARTATGTDPGVTLDPAAAGFDGRRLGRLARHLDECVAGGLNRGSIVLVARRGELVHVSSHGTRDAEGRLPVEPDTIWRLYSMTKPVTSVAALILWEEGVLSLSDPVERFLPSFARMRVHRPGEGGATVPAVEPIRIRHLLTHTAGLTVTGLADNPVNDAYRAAGIAALGEPEPYTLDELCERLASLPLLFEPGSAWNYSHATDVLGRIIEIASGMRLDAFMAKRIFEPLAMTDTGYRLPAGDRPAAPYRVHPRTGRLELMPDPGAAAGDLPTLVAGGHGLLSTARDYQRFVQMLARGGELDGERLLAPRTVELMAANHLPGDSTMSAFSHPPARTAGIHEGRGFGFGVAPLLDPHSVDSLSSAGEYGWGGAAGTNFWVDPEKDLTVLFMTQVMPPPDDTWLALRRLVYQALVR
ncbi:serine hydrolase domain-containing protein [Actinoallomurus rhizosphaericola]|uniref:serine hydrolase domain-containing protein n=1 Tax=Actinoallomurus rhizosphaericola TaxID=2952536 RepID=UPI00209027AC|nr:serine hydrolase domain-containing protein [Actinoallomurus rhizosphaericola]MCO5992956.1 beta-lactamase family protein [Actinoallomurus rhizosphaericola]